MPPMLNRSVNRPPFMAKLQQRKSYALTRLTRGVLCCLLLVIPLVPFKSKSDSVVATPTVSTPLPMGVWQPIAMPTDDEYFTADFSAVDGWALGIHHLAHWDGERWTSYLAPDGYDQQNPISVQVLSPKDAWILEVRGVVFHWDGYQWRQSPLPLAPDGNDLPEHMDFVSPTLGWMVGFAERQANVFGIIFEWNGSQWTRWEIPHSVFFAIDVAAPTDGWMAEESGLLWRWNGKDWRRYDAQTFAPGFVTFAMVNARDGWMARADTSVQGTLWHWDGTRWRQVQQVKPVVGSIAMVRSDYGWAVGLDREAKRNVLLHWDGRTWSDYPIDAKAPLFYVLAKTVDDGWIWGGDVSWDNSTPTAGKTVFRYRLVSAATPTASATTSATSSPTASASPPASPTKTRVLASATATPLPPTSTRVTLTPTPLTPTPMPPSASAMPTPTAPLSITRLPEIPAQWVVVVVLLILWAGGILLAVYLRRRA